MKNACKLPTSLISLSALFQNNFINFQAFGDDFFKNINGANATSAHNTFILSLENTLAQRYSHAGFNIEQLADVMAMCPRTLYRKTITLLSVNPNRLLRLYRLSKAIILLQQGSPVSDTAIAVGFENLSYFSKCFRQEFHELPSNYQNRTLIKQNMIIK